LAEIQAWFAPLLWILGTITALVAFVRLCKPVWTFLNFPKQVAADLSTLDSKLDKHFKDIDGRLDRFEKDVEQLKAFDKLSEEVQINLLRDRLSQGYHYYASSGKISSEAYRSLCDIHEVYHKCGGNSYANNIMQKLHELYKNHPA
jgi:hypothetical protein